MGLCPSKKPKNGKTLEEDVDANVVWKVLWDYNSKAQGHISLRKGTEVIVKEVTRDLEKKLIVAKVQHLGREQYGLINGAFLVARQLYQEWGGLDDKWYVGERSAIEAGMCLRKAGPGAQNKGSFLVCSPEELRHSVGCPEYVIVVRRISDREYKILRDLSKKKGASLPRKYQKFKETLPNGKVELSSPIAFCIIHRGASGCYMVDEKLWFENLYALILHYQRDKGIDSNARLGSYPPEETILQSGLTFQSVPPPPTMPGHEETETPSEDSSRESSDGFSYRDDGRKISGFGLVDKIDQSEFSWNKNLLKGRGNFGLEMYKGKWNNSLKGECTVVAKCLQNFAKYVNNTFEIEMTRDFVLKSDYIVPFYGVTFIHENKFLVVSQWYEFGPLDSYLRERKPRDPFPLRGLVEILHQIVCGMKYAESRSIMHRNLSARNCIVTREDDDTLCVKISDFGTFGAMDSDLFWKEIEKEKLPYKWMAVEVLNCTRTPMLTTFCDVWSFGIVMFEVLTHGDEPYDGMNLREVEELLKNGDRLPEKSTIPQFLLPMAESCWKEVPIKRPTFERLAEKFCRLVYSPVTDSNSWMEAETASREKSTFSTTH